MSYKIKYHERPDGTMVLQYSGDAQSLVDHCADYVRANQQAGQSDLMRRPFRKKLSIDPVVALHEAQKRGMDPFDPDLWKVFKDRDFAKFRTDEDKRYFRTRNPVISLGKKNAAD